MDILHQEQGNEGMFYVEGESKPLAAMTYRKVLNGTIIIDHTEVDKALEGKGVGKQLVSKAVAYAREKNIKIIPRCSFAKALFDKMPSFQDVLDR